MPWPHSCATPSGSAHRDGALRQDFDAIDLLITLRMLGAAAGANEAGKNIDRYADVVLKGLSPS